MSWNQLREHCQEHTDRRILDLFDDTDRAANYSVRACDMLLDYSKTAIDKTACDLLLRLAEAAGVADATVAMMRGEPINETEGRAVLHTALRNPGWDIGLVNGKDPIASVRRALAQMTEFAEAVRSGGITAPSGERFTDVVNIGIGGSDLGPAMATQALSPYADGPRTHFVSNIDGAHIHDVLASLDPTKTLFIVASKTFTTIETMTNAGTARDWIAASVGEAAVGGHFAAVSTAVRKTAEFGISATRVFGFEDWVGGRYSVWGPVGLSLMLAIGPKKFEEFLSGGAAMDAHFRDAKGVENMPLMVALTGIWHNQICGYATRAVLPYDQRLSRLPAYLQQLEMESNGKRVAMDGSDLMENSGPVVWGEPGTNGQHAFYQLIHQGTRVVPCEFMVARQGHEPDLAHQHRLLVANCLAQSEALMRGRTQEEASAMLIGKFEGKELDRQARHRVFPGNRPSTTLVYDKLTPRILGQIIALYEHRVFAEGVILGINSFDQWGVELGKELAVALQPMVEGRESGDEKDGSTRQLLGYLTGDG